ncbi:hypothetical protein DFJ73DRAFT_765099 [Zopfochytrium polystomum]|nr:hypothetical protein DFJ73DRAFT_765099 [Zopfochytrium polystomum]
MSAPPFVQGDCLYLDEKTACGADYFGYPISLKTAGVADYASFVSTFNNYADATWTTNFISSWYGCPNDAKLSSSVNTMRFTLSSICATLVLSSIQSGCQVATNYKPYGPLLCSTECGDYDSDMSAIIENSACTNTTNAAGKVSRMNDFCTASSSLTTANGGCLAGIAAEKAFCGYRSQAVAQTACAGSTDSCCTALLAKLSPSSSSSSPSLVAPIVGAIAGLVVIIAVVIGAVFFLKKTARRPYQMPSTGLQSPGFAPYSANGTQDRFQTQPFSPAAPSPAAHYQQSTLDRRQKESLERRKQESLDRRQKESLDRRQQQMQGQQQQQVQQQMQHQMNMHQQSLQSNYQVNQPAMELQSMQPKAYTPSPFEQVIPEHAPSPAPAPVSAPSPALASVLAPVPTSSALASNEQVGRGSVVSASASEAPTEERLMVIVHPYNPTLPDELTLEPGLDVIMLKSFDDGWALGMNPITGQQGAFPVVCVVAKDEWSATRSSFAPSEATDLRISKRISSVLFSSDELNRLQRASVLAKSFSAAPGSPHLSVASGGLSGSSPLAVPKANSFIQPASPAVAQVPAPAPALAPAPVAAHLLHANSKSVKFDSGVPPTVHVYPRESMMSQFSESTSSDFSSR